ncbi:MAG: carbohydrate kinase family protein [Candidatus Bathyarchaeia archaeon]
MSNSRRDKAKHSLGDLLVLGDLCLDVDVFYEYKKGSSQRASKISLGEGGSGGNVAFMAERLGLETGLAAPISNDSMGSLLESMVKQRHGNLSFYPLKDPEQTTCIIVSMINKRGARRAYFKTNEGNCKLQSLYEIASKYSAIHLSGYTLELFDVGELSDFVHETKMRGVEITLDLFPRIGLATESKAELDHLLEDVDFLFGNLQEFRALTGSPQTSDILQDFLNKGRNLVIKKGSKGAIFAGPIGIISSPPLKVKPFSLKGAGDSFIAGFLASHLRGYSIQQALNAANLIAGTHVADADEQITQRSIDL